LRAQFKAYLLSLFRTVASDGEFLIAVVFSAVVILLSFSI